MCLLCSKQGKKIKIKDNWLLPLATSWIFQTNFINHFALCDFHILNLSTSQLPPPHCLLVPLCLVFTSKPPPLALIFLRTFIIVPQSWKQVVSVLLWSLILVQAITVDMVRGWIREVNQNFGRASHGEQLGESYAWCTILWETKSYTTYEIDYVKLWTWVPNHELVHNM